MSEQLPEVVVVVEPPLPEVQVTVEAPLPTVQVTSSEVGLVGPAGSAADISAHVNDPNPHPVYEESGPNLLARYRSRKV